MLSQNGFGTGNSLKTGQLSFLNRQKSRSSKKMCDIVLQTGLSKIERGETADM